ncbi:hypothetical protein ABBQ32_004903 [Trebouxia sp. C0010 RCD-2024]
MPWNEMGCRSSWRGPWKIWSTRLCTGSPGMRLSFDQCPAQLATSTAQLETNTTYDDRQQVLLLPDASGDEAAVELLEWFKEEACKAYNPQLHNTRPYLRLPSHISKEQRARWHKLAEQQGLMSQSQGTGSNRQLQIMCPTATNTNSGLSARARQIWRWCQAEGGQMWSISQGEVQAMLQEGGCIPSKIQQMIKKRELGMQLAQLLQGRDTDAALNLLSAEPSLAWIRDDDSGGYPLHIAVWHNLRPVISQLLTVPNTTEQRDGRRDTPLMLARQQGLKDVVCQLLAAGATDLRSCSSEADSRTWSPGQHRPYTSKRQTASSSATQPESTDGPAPPGLSHPVRRPPGLHKVNAHSLGSCESPPGFSRFT